MSELIIHFGIDWKLLLAQAINFFVLLFLLWKFAYRPILGMLKKRKEDIEKGIAFTQKAEEELKRTGEMREEAMKKAYQDALSTVSEAEALGKKRKDEMVQEAHRRVEGVVAEARRAIEEEKNKMGESVQKSAEELVRVGVERVLGKLPAETRNESFITDALKELRKKA